MLTVIESKPYSVMKPHLPKYEAWQSMLRSFCRNETVRDGVEKNEGMQWQNQKCATGAKVLGSWEVRAH